METDKEILSPIWLVNKYQHTDFVVAREIRYAHLTMFVLYNDKTLVHRIEISENENDENRFSKCVYTSDDFIDFLESPIVSAAEKLGEWFQRATTCKHMLTDMHIIMHKSDISFFPIKSDDPSLSHNGFLKSYFTYVLNTGHGYKWGMVSSDMSVETITIKGQIVTNSVDDCMKNCLDVLHRLLGVKTFQSKDYKQIKKRADEDQDGMLW